MNDSNLHMLAKAFHDEYEYRAKLHGWHTQESCKVEWEDLPTDNRATMIATVFGLHQKGLLSFGPAIDTPRPTPDVDARPLADRMTEAYVPRGPFV